MKTILVGINNKGAQERLILSMANRHGLITGATGTGKTITLQRMAEQFSLAGIPVFTADVKGDLASLAYPGQEKLSCKVSNFELWKQIRMPLMRSRILLT